jgi:hypothetical protein
MTLEQLAAQCGYDDVITFLREENDDAICWGICSNCEYADQDVEPDLTDGECPGCYQYTYNSVLVVAGMI